MKRKWYLKSESKGNRFFEMFKVVVHKSYMLKAVLTSKCPQGGQKFSFPTIREQMTCYDNKYDNFFCGCKECQKKNEQFWDEMWEEYYSSYL